VTDDEVVPERPDGAELPDHRVRTGERPPASSVWVRRWRRSRPTRARAKAAMAGTRTTRAASDPGHTAPAPSAPQKVPKPVSITPTTNFMLFSGTRASGARTRIPAAATTSTAAPAA